MRADRETERAVLAAVDVFFDHLANRRLDEAVECFAPDADVALYGSEVSEVAIGPTALREFLGGIFRKAGPRFTFKERAISAAGDVAWLTAAATVTIGDAVAGSYRLTLVLERRDGHWLIVLFNGSEPVPDRR